MSPREKAHLCGFPLFSVFKATASESINKGQLQHSRGERLIFVLFLPLRLRSLGHTQQQHRYGQPGGGQARDPGGVARGVLEIPDAPQPASVPQVQHLLGQGCTVWGLHSQRAAAITCTGVYIHSIYRETTLWSPFRKKKNTLSSQQRINQSLHIHFISQQVFDKIFPWARLQKYFTVWYVWMLSNHLRSQK